MHSNHCGDTMTTKTRPRFNPEFEVLGAVVRPSVGAVKVDKTDWDTIIS